MTKNILEKTADAVETKSGAVALSAAFILSPFLSALTVAAFVGEDTPQALGTTQVSQQFEKNAQLRIDSLEAQLSRLEYLKESRSQTQDVIAQKEARLLHALSSFKSEILSNENIKPQDYQKIAEEFNSHFADGFPETSSTAYLEACRAENTTGEEIATCMTGTTTSSNSFVLLWILAIAGAASAGYTVAQGNVSKNTAKTLRKLGQKL